MKKLVIASSVVASTFAVAGDYKINIEGRSDLTMNTNKTTAQAGTTTETKYTSFKNNIVRLNALANVNDSLSLRFRYRFTKNENDLARDGSSDMLDFLYADHKNAYFTTRFGKQSWSNAAGRESMVSGSDVILTSAAYSALKGSSATDGIGEYRFGATAMFTFLDGHNLSVALSNPNKTVTATTGASKNNSLAYGVYYNSSLMNKMVQPTLALTIAPQDGDTEAAAGAKTKKGNYTLWSAGLRSEVVGAVIDADYKAHTKENTASADYKKDQFALGVMYKPFAEANFRYHLAYTSSTQKFDSSLATNKEVKDTNVIFGIKADI